MTTSTPSYKSVVVPRHSPKRQQHPELPAAPRAANSTKVSLPGEAAALHAGIWPLPHQAAVGFLQGLQLRLCSTGRSCTCPRGGTWLTPGLPAGPQGGEHRCPVLTSLLPSQHCGSSFSSDLGLVLVLCQQLWKLSSQPPVETQTLLGLPKLPMSCAQSCYTSVQPPLSQQDCSCPSPTSGPPQKPQHGRS